ncbi:hypothetical protein MRX96_028084 [Rhipicephalus microplus]
MRLQPPTFWPVKRRPHPRKCMLRSSSIYSPRLHSVPRLTDQQPASLSGSTPARVYATLVIHLLSSASLGAATDGPAAREPQWLDTSAGTSTQCASNPNILACQAAPPPEECGGRGHYRSQCLSRPRPGRQGNDWGRRW